MSDLIRKVEAILFAASKRMTVEELSGFVVENTDEEIGEALNGLTQEYAEKNTSLTLLKENDTWKISLKDEYLPFAESLMPSTDLSKPVIETLAIIAWKNPILQSDLVKLRSAVVYDHIAELEKLKLITKSRKGRSYILKVTERFHEYFDLPQAKSEEMFGQYEEPKPVEVSEDVNIFNKGDSFDASVDERDQRLIEEIKANTIDPEAIIKEDKEFLDNFDQRLENIQKESNAASETLKEMEVTEEQLEEGAYEKSSELDEAPEFNNTVNEEVTENEKEIEAEGDNTPEAPKEIKKEDEIDGEKSRD